MSRKNRRRAPGFFGGEARSDSSDEPVSLWRFLAPRYWKVWILVGWLRLNSVLPWRFTLSLHKRIGRSLGAWSRKSSAIVEENIARCFPELSPAERADLRAEHFANMGAVVAELALAWFGRVEKVQALFEVEGKTHLDRALAD